MNRVVAAAGLALLAGTASVRADESLIEPGQWKVTSIMSVNGRLQPTEPKLRCISPEQAADVARTFGPVSGTINSTCADPDIKLDGKSLKWRLQCRGQLDADVEGQFEFDNPHHYTAAVASQGRMAGTVISDVKTALKGERLGDCPP